MLRDFLDFIHDYVLHSSIMKHGSFFFQPIAFKLEQFLYMFKICNSLSFIFLCCMYMLLFQEPIVEKSKGKITSMRI